MPFSHDLPVYLVRYPQYGASLELLAQALPADGYIMDIGANVGDTALLIRRFGNWPIVCVEGEPGFLTYLRVNTEHMSNVEILPVYADSGTSFNSVIRSAGTARLETKRGRRCHPVPTRSLEEIHGESGGGARCTLIKIDTDGLDLLILHQALAWLERERPVLFLEYAPAWLRKYTATAASALLLGLRDAGYRHITAFTNLGAPFGAYALDSIGIGAMSNDIVDSAVAYLDLAMFPSGQANDEARHILAKLTGLSLDKAVTN
jgi:FkbM family methyltransferase